MLKRRAAAPITRDVLTRKLTLAAAAAALLVAATPAASHADPKKPTADVCNEAENSWQGGYTVTGDPVDPNPPARLLGSQMRVGNGHGVGLENAAYHSPALRLCGPDDGSGDGGGSGTGGGSNN